MKAIRRIDPFSVGKVAFVWYAVVGLLAGAIFTIMGLLGATAAFLGGEGGTGIASAVLGLVFGVGAIIFVPLFYGVMGAIVTMLGAFLYNVVATLTGGVVVHLE